MNLSTHAYIYLVRHPDFFYLSINRRLMNGIQLILFSTNFKEATKVKNEEEEDRNNAKAVTSVAPLARIIVE